MTSTDFVLEANNLTRTYGRGDNRFDALKGVSLDVRRGESVAIIGKSGSGKSTLMHILALLDKPTSGRLVLNGQNSTDLSAKEVNKVRNSTFGFVFQQFFLTPKTSVLENVVLPLKIAGVSSSERRRRGMEALDALGIAEKAKNDANSLSGGQKQRVVIARALVNDPALIFADEPTGNLDTTTGESVEQMLFGLQRERGITLVVVTHDPDLAGRCDRSVYVRDGLIVAQDLEVAAS
ncbi:ABC transporter ATP-binding protein [Rathayibacter sp. ZW T2_19]|uniref:ABC transporter ATP-binding protein n=1 Tax=Rathayibacter rubneri TaxID=2950106 RepID=A0A9X2DU33_9MICO|nr:ABC transporter ATP-binding protein [Rathayibacter rubneri]MCM6761160.1 ABC transporter ATP-binding protein [Rathayibacter rubneri]